jgi:hypothetical protein
MKAGRITPNGVVLQPHENATVVFFTEQGYDIKLIPPIQSKGARTPDIIMAGLEWEMKAPTSNGKYTIEHSFRSALRQSSNVIFDVRWSKMPQKKWVTEIERRFRNFGKAKGF